MEFKELIANFLSRSKLRREYIDLFTNEKNLQKFKIAFTDASFDQNTNYEYYEFVGDVVVNKTLVFYILYRFPQVKKQGWLTKIKHYLMSGRYLGMLADKYGFFPHIRFAGKVQEAFEQNPILHHNEEYTKLLENVFEAFVGCFMEICDEIFYYGVGDHLMFEIFKSLLDAEEISIKYEDIFDPVSRLKEIYDQMKIPFNTHFSTFENKNAIFDRKFTTNVYYTREGYTNKVQIATHTGRSKDETRRAAALIAIKIILENRPDIKERIPSYF